MNIRGQDTKTNTKIQTKRQKACRQTQEKMAGKFMKMERTLLPKPWSEDADDDDDNGYCSVFSQFTLNDIRNAPFQFTASEFFRASKFFMLYYQTGFLSNNFCFIYVIIV